MIKLPVANGRVDLSAPTAEAIDRARSYGESMPCVRRAHIVAYVRTPTCVLLCVCIVRGECRLSKMRTRACESPTSFHTSIWLSKAL